MASRTYEALPPTHPLQILANRADAHINRLTVSEPGDLILFFLLGSPGLVAWPSSDRRKGGQCLSEASLPAPVPVNRAGHLKGHVTVKMVLATFAETKGARRTGAKPRLSTSH